MCVLELCRCFCSWFFMWRCVMCTLNWSWKCPGVERKRQPHSWDSSLALFCVRLFYCLRTKKIYKPDLPAACIHFFPSDDQWLIFSYTYNISGVCIPLCFVLHETISHHTTAQTSYPQVRAHISVSHIVVVKFEINNTGLLSR